jgi:choline dehydrogenase
MGRANLTVMTGCLVTRLTVRDDRCVGAEYVRDGKPEWAPASAEVIVCAGAIGSPQLLLLSGIGPAAQLRDCGINLVADLPGVGEQLQDHPFVMACYAAPAPLRPSAYNHGETYSALRSPQAGDWPDLHLFPILLPLAAGGRPAPDGGFALVASAVGVASRGTVRLASADPETAPLIDPRFLTEAADLNRLEAGLGIIRRAVADAAMAPLGISETWPGPGVCDSAGLRDWIRHSVCSYWHPAGTCRIGADEGAVTDPQLRVHGIAGLRVADASVMPTIPNAHPHATVLAIAEKAAALITGVP